MLRISPVVLERIASENGWMHERGRLKGTLNATAMAEHLQVAVSTVTRAYDTGALGTVLLSKLALLTGWSLDVLATVEAEAA
ncbi:hypothetical protein [Microbacterium sp. UCD-TDU]|uniref:hypothetical protein n=1 Tax=Microbacterium sp. UCD-TDU TaxID=1247714 RepID=UPI00034AB7B0|nr:hypothetical protein [Microbacterium sp. UCD-TDU]EYT61661.1 hypothetical protein D514_0102380 [Microbacterium sp. UCD-TDU]